MRAPEPRAQRRALLRWFEDRRSAYPWRAARDPYAILVSEVMLQQTQASRVAPVYVGFMGAFPTVEALAAAPRSAVVRAWGGLGHNRRAVSLHRAARIVARDHAGVVPREPEALRALPGVGPYTAAAVASIAYGRAVAAIDTNARRVVGRVRSGSDALPAPDAARLAATWLDRSRPGDWNQAVMDVGRLFCRPLPACTECPLRSSCRFAGSGSAVRPRPKVRAPFDGSMRQVRGDVVRVLRSRHWASIATIEGSTGHPRDRVIAAVVALVSDGLVAGGPGALRGAARGRVRLAT